MSADFNPEQKRYLEGFASGLQTARAARRHWRRPAAQNRLALTPRTIGQGAL